MILGNIFHNNGYSSESEELNLLIKNLRMLSREEWSLLLKTELNEKVMIIPVRINENLNRVAESHLKCADLHFIIEGYEIHRFWNSNETLGPKEEFPKDDNIFYHSIDTKKGILIQLNPGDFVVYWPGEIHISGIGITNVKKIVYKIKI